MTARLIIAIISTALEELALVVLWRWGLPQLGIKLPLYVLIIAMITLGAYSVTTFWIVTRTLKKKGVIGLPTMIGGRGKAATPLTPEGLVRIKGELWGASSVDGNLDSGEKVFVVGQDGLKLMVRKGDAEQPTH